MAIFHLHIDCYRRSRGRTAIGGAAYRRGLKASCPVSGRRFNFRKKSEVAFSEFIPAQNDLTDYSQLSNLLLLYEAIERGEKHPRATLGREIEAALPHELTLPQQVELVRGFVAEVRQRFGCEKAFFDFSIHAKPNNTHAHIAFSEREQIAPFVFAKTKRRDWDGDEFVRACREIWQSQTNSALEQAGIITQRVDCRSHADRGIKLLPTLHEGRAAYFDSEVKKMNDIIKQKNQEIKARLIIPEDVIDINELRTKASPSLCRNPDALDAKKFMSEDFQYRLAKKQYESFDILGLSYINLKHPNRITLWFNDRSSIVDKGTLITANGGTAQANAQR
ncbi:MAG: MobA/MobL family protein, partial [Candidatus Obscuribacterales bacterium]|nr:MobA/MobL family protein [Candidatus Obscuribacterales bacterium]